MKLLCGASIRGFRGYYVDNSYHKDNYFIKYIQGSVVFVNGEEQRKKEYRI